jgi:ATP-binding cassette, subfamily C, bacterial LapB
VGSKVVNDLSLYTHISDGLLVAAKIHGVSPSFERMKLLAESLKDETSDPLIIIERLADLAGLTAQKTDVPIEEIPSTLFPLLHFSASGEVCVLHDWEKENIKVSFISDEPIAEKLVLPSVFGPEGGQLFLIQPLKRVQYQQIEHLPKREDSWLWKIILPEKKTLIELAVAAFVGSLISLAVSLFSMQIWDRVIPAASINTLWVLTFGVFVALIIDFILRNLRVSIADFFGKRANLKMSNMVFSHMLDIRNDARPKSLGSLIAQVRDVEQVREGFTSTIINSVLDLPFMFLFIFVIWLIGGSLAYIPLLAIPIILIPGILLQFPLHRLSRAGMEESAQRNAILMESVYRIEDIKSFQAEARFSRIWNSTNQVAAKNSMEERKYRTFIVNWSNFIQQLAYIGVIVAGVYGIFNGLLSNGALLACSILTSRAISPIGQVAGALSTIQSAFTGKGAVDALLKLPVDHGAGDAAFHRAELKGNYELETVAYTYGGTKAENIAIGIQSLKINPSEKIAILGKIGSGKSTLLRLLGGLCTPTQGQMLLDGTLFSKIDVADVRRDVGLLLQDSGLFSGTLRDNLMIANPLASEEELMTAIKVACADSILLNQPEGLDHRVREGGQGLSGGQRQSLLMARLILRNPNIVLLDEPTASFDDGTERQIVKNIGAWIGKRTLIVATHRFAPLELVDRIIVLDSGRVVLDGPKAEVIARLQAQS